MTLLSPLGGAYEDPANTPAPAESQVFTVDAVELPPLRVTTDAAVPLVEAAPLRLLDEDGVRAAVGRFAAATLLPAAAPEATRVQVRESWARAVTVVEVSTHPDWTLAFVPGSHVGDALVHAVHRPTGHVFGGDSGATVQQSGETTQVWLDRLTVEFADHAAAYAPRYVRLDDHA